MIRATVAPLAVPAGSTASVRRRCACGGKAGPGGECAGCRRKRLERQEERSTRPDDVAAGVSRVLRAPGRPLDPQTRAAMESRFGHDFGRVRIHADAQAAESAQAVNALAYTVGRDVVFGAGQYAPETSLGRRLLAHELVHVVQQGSRTAAVGTSLEVDSPVSAEERQAASFAADDASRSRGAAGLGGGQPGNSRVQRQPADPDPAKSPAPAKAGEWGPDLLRILLYTRDSPPCFGTAGSSGVEERLGACVSSLKRFCVSSIDFELRFNVDAVGYRHPGPHTPRAVSVEFSFTPDGGTKSSPFRKNDPKPTYLGEGEPLRPDFGQKVSVPLSSKRGVLSVRAELSDPLGRVVYDDSIGVDEVQGCV